MSLPDPPEGCLHDVDNTIKYLEESTRVWKLYRNTLIPVSRLPPEILSIIFALLPSFGLLTVINFPLSNLLFALGPLTPIPHVCHRWREISLNLPYLWNHIDFTRLTSAGTAEILARSNMAPLHLEAQTMQWNNGKFLAFIKQLMTHIHHIRHLRVTVTPENLEEMFTQLVSSAPSLERLSIANDDIHQQEALVLPDNLFDGIAPKLIDLRLNNCGIRWESPLLKGLQNLKLISFPTRALTTLKPWLDALNQMPQLERLSLHGGIPIHSVTRLEAGLTVVLFSLTELDISAPARQCIAVFAHLVLPALTGLRVSVRTHHKNDTLSNYVRRLIPHVARNAHGPHDTEPLQSLFVGGDEEQSKVVAWTGPRQDTDVELRRLARVTFSTTTQYGLVEKDIPMHDVLLTALPINSITSLTVNGRTPLSREVWRTHAPRWDKLDRVHLSPNAVPAFREMLEDAPRGEPLLPSLEELVLNHVWLGAKKAYYLYDMLIDLVELDIPLRTLDLRKCNTSDRAVQLLSEIVVDVWGGGDEREDDFDYVPPFLGSWDIGEDDEDDESLPSE